MKKFALTGLATAVIALAITALPAGAAPLLKSCPFYGQTIQVPSNQVCPDPGHKCAFLSGTSIWLPTTQACPVIKTCPFLNHTTIQVIAPQTCPVLPKV